MAMTLTIHIAPGTIAMVLILPVVQPFPKFTHAGNVLSHPLPEACQFLLICLHQQDISINEWNGIVGEPSASDPRFDQQLPLDKCCL
jgi:hypothetical protein